MKDEIKEILDDLGNKDSYINDETILTFDEAKDILDYITNLQEENERLIRGTTLLRNKLIDMTKAKEDYKSRNEKYEKAINEIKEKIDDYFGYDYENESQARLDTINEINYIIVDLYNGGDE